MTYGCYNRKPLVDTVIVRFGYGELIDEGWGNFSRVAVLAEIPNPMTKDCQYSKTTLDQRCAGCKWDQHPADTRSLPKWPEGETIVFRRHHKYTKEQP